MRARPLTVVLFVAAVVAATSAAGTPQPDRPQSRANADRKTTAAARPKSVRIIYLVSQDRPVSLEYKTALGVAARDLQKWYAKQLGGPTFRLNGPIVEIVQSDKPAAWFYSHPNGDQQDDWGFNNGLAEAERLVGARCGDPNYIWVIYSDGPGNKGRGGSGAAVLPEDDLLGLIGKHPTQKDVPRWIAGLGHELGHAFGLAHPKDTEKDADALMWTGIYGKYPDHTYLTEQDKRILRRSPFFFYPNGEAVTSRLRLAEKYVYPGGYFGRPTDGGRTEWLELKADGSGQMHFEETGRDEKWILLFDDSREMTVRLPVGGGTCSWSTDAGKTWHELCRVARE
jgi:hypothetical protein